MLLRKRVFRVLPILVVCVLTACHQSPQARRDKYIARGQAQMLKGDYGRAIVEFKNAIAATPKDPQPYYQLGVAAETAGDVGTAITCFNKALQLQPSHANAQLKLSEILASANAPVWLTEAERRLQTLMQHSSVTSEMLDTLALAQLKLGKQSDAVQDLQQALNKAPGELQASALLAKIKLTQGDTAGAEKILASARDANPKSPQTHIVLGRFYAAQNNPKAAEAEFRQAVALNPKDGEAILSLASFQLAAGQTSQAEANYKLISRLGDRRYSSAYAQFLMQQGRKNEALAELQRLYQADPGDRDARTRLVAAYQLDGRTTDARKVLDAALAKNPKDSDALLQRAEFLLSLGSLNAAELDLNKMIAQQPNSADAHYIRAKLFEAKHQDLSYRQELEEALRLAPARTRIRVELAQAYLAQDDPQAALALYDAAPPGEAQMPDLIAGRNWALWSANDMADMRKGIDAGLAIERTPDLLIQDGLWKVKAGKVAEGRASVEEALRIDPNNIRALAALTRAYASEKDQSFVLEKVQEYAKKSQTAPVQHFLGLLELRAGQRDQARQAFETAVKLNPDYIPAELSLTQLDADQSRWNDVIVNLRRVVAQDPRNPRALLWLGDAAVAQGNLGAALDAYQKALAANPDDPTALNNVASLLMDYRHQPDQALPLAQKAVELAPNNPSFADTLGWVLYNKGLYPTATQYLKRADSAADIPSWKYHLAMALAREGNLKDARATYEIAKREAPSAPEAAQAGAVVGAAK